MTREREREREIKLERTKKGLIKVELFSCWFEFSVGGCRFVVSERSTSTKVADGLYKEIAYLYEKTFKLEKKLRDLAGRYETVYKTRPNIFVGAIFKSKKFDEVFLEELILWKEIIKKLKKYGEILDRIGEVLDRDWINSKSKISGFYDNCRDIETLEKRVNRDLEAFQKKGLIGDFETEGNVKKIIKDYLNKEKFEGRTEVKPLLEQIREGMGAPVNRWLLGKIWANPITQLFLIFGIIVGLLKVLWNQFVKENK